MIKKIAGSDLLTSGVPVQRFAEFLKQKVDKKSDLEHLYRITQMIDIDHDGMISELDLSTCLKNLSNSLFWDQD